MIELVGFHSIFFGFKKDERCCEKKDGRKTGFFHFIVFKLKCKKGKRSLMTIIVVLLVAMVAAI